MSSWNAPRRTEVEAGEGPKVFMAHQCGETSSPVPGLFHAVRGPSCSRMGSHTYTQTHTAPGPHGMPSATR